MKIICFSFKKCVIIYVLEEEWGVPLFPVDGGIMEIAKKVRDMIESIIISSGYVLDDVLYIKEDGQYFLRIVIDKEGIITVDDCICVTQKINPILDKEDPIEQNYILDVCSKEKGCD